MAVKTVAGEVAARKAEQDSLRHGKLAARKAAMNAGEYELEIIEGAGVWSLQLEMETSIGHGYTKFGPETCIYLREAFP